MAEPETPVAHSPDPKRPWRPHPPVPTVDGKRTDRKKHAENLLADLDEIKRRTGG